MRRDPSTLTRREQELLALLCRGMTIVEAATAMGNTLETSKSRARLIRAKLGASTTLQATVIAAKAGIV